MSDTPDAIEPLIEGLLKEIGEDPGHEGLVHTPHRVAEAVRFFTTGYGRDPQAILHDALFEVDYDEMVIVKDIDFYSLCEHHLLPFFGRAHVAYIPNGKVVGLSKIPMLVEMFTRRLQVQERLTMEVAETLERVLQPKGVAVVIEAIHLCMVMRGVKKPGSNIITSAIRGLFRRRAASRAEFFSLIQNK